MADSHDVLLTIPALPEYVGVVRLAVSGVAARMNFSVDVIEDIKVSVSEACTNVIQHAYSKESTSNNVIEVKMSVNDKDLNITVQDFGQGFDLSTLGTTEQKHKSKQKLGLGLGLTFIESLMDDTHFQSKIGEGTTIQMKKQSPNLSLSSVS